MQLVEQRERAQAEARIKARQAGEIEAEVAAEIDAERQRQERVAAAEAEQARRNQVKAEIADLAGRWMVALDEAEAGATTMAKALHSAFEIGAEINSRAVTLHLRDRLASGETAARIGRRLTQLLRGLHDTNRFGGIRLDTRGAIHPGDTGNSWKEAERANNRWLCEFKPNGEIK